MDENQKKELEEITAASPLLQAVSRGEEVFWVNPGLEGEPDMEVAGLSLEDVREAEERLRRFAPFIRTVFPETEEAGGLIESPLREIPAMLAALNETADARIQGRLFVKLDSHLPIAGSVKARGGIYEILKHSEDLALGAGLLKTSDDYAILAEDRFREFFSGYAVHVGSTGNLGLSIGIISAKVGYRVTVHMSADARQWKKDLLRRHGVEVKEYAGDYGKAVAEGRALSDRDPNSYFVDDENSRTLFYGYAVAAGRLDGQLKEQGVAVDDEHPLFVYIPCGVGGAPGGIAYGLKALYGSNVHVFFVEPTEAPCMLAGMATGLNSDVSVQDLGRSGLTEADGLAVGRPSGFVGEVMAGMLSGIVTLKDYRLFDYLRALDQSEGLFIEPSACAAFAGPEELFGSPKGQRYLEVHGLKDGADGISHIAWATGGALVPEEERAVYLARRL